MPPNSAPEPDDPLRADLIAMIRDRDYATHRQRALGPSEVGHPCMRKMAYGMTELPPCNPQFDPTATAIGDWVVVFVP
jgi:hypothetical protein